MTHTCHKITKTKKSYKRRQISIFQCMVKNKIRLQYAAQASTVRDVTHENDIASFNGKQSLISCSTGANVTSLFAKDSMLRGRLKLISSSNLTIPSKNFTTWEIEGLFL